LGPRQCGKTTFIKSELRGWQYTDLEKPSHRIPFEADPEARIEQLKSEFILDEAQQIPELFPVLRSFIDMNRKKNGQVVLLGSASPHLIKGISESLAGRVAFLELTPFLLKEIKNIRKDSINSLWIRGGFPDPFLINNDLTRIDWYDNYVRTFIERDLNAIGVTVSSSQMRKLWSMLAHSHGSIWNASNIAGSMGINYQTVNKYVEILEKAFLVRRLNPFFANIGKRLIKSPKIYIRDTGILHYFLGISKQEQLDINPYRGKSWEGFVIEQLISIFSLYKPSSSFYYWRTSGGAEVDILIETGGEIFPFEIKLHSSPSLRLAKGLVNCMEDLKIKNGYVIYPGHDTYSLGHGVKVIPAESLLSDTNLLSILYG
jgi:predicted AAA+ superfamily ATPase